MTKYQFEALSEEVQEMVINHCYNDLWESDMTPTHDYVEKTVREFLYTPTGRIVDVVQ